MSEKINDLLGWMKISFQSIFTYVASVKVLPTLKKLGCFLGILLFISAIYAAIYYNFPSWFLFEIGNPPRELNSYCESLYFSLVTITTLGYGEIVPTHDIGRFVVTTEPIVGLFIVGWLINNFWRDHLESIAVKREQEKVIFLKESILAALKDYRDATLDLRSAFSTSTHIQPIECVKPSDLSMAFKVSNIGNYFGWPRIDAYFFESESFEKKASFFLSYLTTKGDTELSRLLIDILKSIYSSPKKPVFETLMLHHGCYPDRKGDEWGEPDDLVSEIQRISKKEYCIGSILTPVCELTETIKDIEIQLNKLESHIQKIVE